jgi:hypothetical protein
VVHNLHYGSRRLNASLDEAEGAYAAAFRSVSVSRALDAKPWAGNAIVAASNAPGVYDDAPRLVAAAARARERHGVTFDLATRCIEQHCVVTAQCAQGTAHGDGSREHGAGACVERMQGDA